MLGRHVIERAQGCASHGQAAVAPRSRNAKVHQLDHALGSEHHVGEAEVADAQMALAVEEQVAGLDVAVDDFLLMRVLQGIEYLTDVIQSIARRNRPLLQTCGQRDAVDILHHHDQLVVEREGGTQGGDVRMVETGQHLDFSQETVCELFLAGQVGQQDLHGLDAVRDDVADFVDSAHSAGTQHGQNFIVAYTLAGWFCHFSLHSWRGEPGGA